MSKSPNWTIEEIELLKTNYPMLGRSKELQELFPSRPIEGICLKANRLGLKVLNNIRKGRTNNEYKQLLVDTNFESLEPYAGSTVPILHKCKVCNHIWKTRPQHALKKDSQCPICDHNSRVLSQDAVNEVLDKAGLFAHTDYIGSFEDITIEHLSCGYVWTTKYPYIQQGSGCPLCNKGFGYNYSKEQLPNNAFLYLLKIEVGSEVFYKVGVSVRKPTNRIREIKCELNKIFGSCSIEFIAYYEDSSSIILNKEQSILSKYTKYNPNIKFSGYTELLDISNNLDNLLKEYNE